VKSSLSVLHPFAVCWNATYTGNETLSHLYEPGNGRITVLFVAFKGPPRIVRLYGTGMYSTELTWITTREKIY
jgi:hypothetical protein